MSIYLGPVVLVLENRCKIQLNFITDSWKRSASGSRMSCFQEKFKETVVKENVSSKFVFSGFFFFVICYELVPNGITILIESGLRCEQQVSQSTTVARASTHSGLGKKYYVIPGSVWFFIKVSVFFLERFAAHREINSVEYDDMCHRSRSVEDQRMSYVFNPQISVGRNCRSRLGWPRDTSIQCCLLAWTFITRRRFPDYSQLILSIQYYSI